MGFAHIRHGRERRRAGEHIARHRHDQAYAAIVLSGVYEECGSRGRFRVQAGDVLLHGLFDAHLDRFHKGDAEILNLALGDFAPRFGFGRLADPDAIARAAERDVTAAAKLLNAALLEMSLGPGDWRDLLAADLLGDPSCRLDRWAESHGIAAETVSRGFGKVFSVSPAAFRAEARARRAFALIRQSSMPLAVIAAATGFADQAHMTRGVRALTDQPPLFWRRSNPFKTFETRAV